MSTSMTHIFATERGFVASQFGVAEGDILLSVVLGILAHLEKPVHQPLCLHVKAEGIGRFELGPHATRAPCQCP